MEMRLLARHPRFDPTFIMHDGKTLRAVRAKCGGCTFETKVQLSDFTATNSHDQESKVLHQVSRKLEKEGWRIGKRVSEDRCPGCIREEIAARQNARVGPMSVSNVVTLKPEDAMPTIVQETAPQPRKMTRDEREAIRLKLKDVYGDENTGYVGDWSDLKVSKDMGVALAWVVEIRSLDFGDIGTNPEMERILTQSKRVLVQAEELHTALMHRAEELIDQIKKCRAEIAKMEKAL